VLERPDRVTIPNTDVVLDTLLKDDDRVIVLFGTADGTLV
jgi:hypothetical protein